MEDEPQEQTNDDEPADQFDPEEIENDPAYEPDDEGLKDLKGG
jgi:hypothetical protein